MLMARNQTCWLNGEILLKTHFIHSSERLLSVGQRAAVSWVVTLHLFLIPFCEHCLFCLFFLNKEEVNIVSLITDGFKVLWYIFPLLIGADKCSVCAVLAEVSSECRCGCGAAVLLSPNTKLSLGPVTSTAPPESPGSHGGSLLWERSSGSLVILHTFIPKVVSDLLFGFDLNLFLSPTTLLLLSVVAINSSGKSQQM